MNSSVVKIAVLEWICGGGLLTFPTEQIDDSLQVEGWQMLSTIVNGLASGGLQVFVPLDKTRCTHNELHSGANVIDVSQLLSPAENGPLDRQSVVTLWRTIAQKCEYVWVVAPEIDGVLAQVIDQLRDCGPKLLNCDGDFLRNSNDKFLTAQRLGDSGLPHPPTLDLARIDDVCLNTIAQGNPTNNLWVIKPTMGAGGAAQRLVTKEQLFQIATEQAASNNILQQTPRHAPQIVQPWVPGRPASCSAIVDECGQRYWFPLVSQDFATVANGVVGPLQTETTLERETNPPQYSGCTYPCVGLPEKAPQQLLEKTLDALGPGAYGWVGIDLIFDGQTRHWTVIEVNARCTSSLVGLAAAYRGSLLPDIFELLTRTEVRPLSRWKPNFQPFQFRLP